MWTAHPEVILQRRYQPASLDEAGHKSASRKLLAIQSRSPRNPNPRQLQRRILQRFPMPNSRPNAHYKAVASRPSLSSSVKASGILSQGR